jgi:uncharacterized protein YegJ (DUF2314 family)
VPKRRFPCPLCAADVECETLAVVFLEIMPKCPSCGGGPVVVNMAALARGKTLDDGGNVVLRLSCEDPQAVADALLELHPSFGDKPADKVLAYVRVRRADGWLAVKTARALAPMFTMAVRAKYPTIRIDADEAIAVAGATPNMAGVHADDAAMARAADQARARIGDFIARLRAPRPGDRTFGVKLAFRDGEQVEHAWITNVRVDGDSFVGTVDNELRDVRSVRRGQEWRVPVADVTDWAFTNGERDYGNYSARALMDVLPPPVRERIARRATELEPA